MPVPAVLVTNDGTLPPTEEVGSHTHLSVEDHSRVATHFKHVASTDAGTTTVVSSRPGNALVVTDIILSQKKVASGTLTIQFDDDDDNTEILAVLDTVTDGVTMHIPFAGRVRGWKDARIEMVSVGNSAVSNVTVMYYHLGGTQVLSFTNWDGLR